MATPAKCRSCPAMVQWRYNTTTGNLGPIDDGTDPTGNCRLVGDEHYETLAPLEAAAAREAGEQLHLSHFVTCPDRAKYGKKKK